MKKEKLSFDEMHSPEEAKNLNATRGKLEKLVKRFALSLRMSTMMAQKDPEKFIDKLFSFALQVRLLQIKEKIFPSDIAMDETPVWNDMVASTTVAATGFH